MKLLYTLLLTLLTFTISAQSNDVLLLTCVINSESHGESFQDKLRVGTVIMNRIKSSGFPNDLYDVIYQQNQFSGIDSDLFCFNISYRDIVGQGRQEDYSYKELIELKNNYDSYLAAKKILAGHREFNDNVLFFYNPNTSTNKKFIASKKGKVVVHGDNHDFTL